MNTFAGRLVCIDRKTDAEHVDEDVLIECVNLKATGEIEIAWTDRNERVYIRFDLTDLIRDALAKHVPSSD